MATKRKTQTGISEWAKTTAERFVADGRAVGHYFQTEDEVRDEKRLRALLVRVYKKAFHAGRGVGILGGIGVKL